MLLLGSEITQYPLAMPFLKIVFCVLIRDSSLSFLEFIAWVTHKHVMHGFLWRWHKSHHTVQNHILEVNDLFVVIFSAICIGLFYYGAQVNYNLYFIAAGIGIFCYGVSYFIFHDIIVYQRIKWKLKKKSKYLQRIIHAHYVHHNKRTKNGCESFGFLISRKKYEPNQFS